FVQDHATPALEDAPLRSKINFRCIHYADGKKRPRNVEIRGLLGGDGLLWLDPNAITVDDDGNILQTTLMDAEHIPVPIKPSVIPDPDKKDRKVYELVPEKQLPRKLLLVLAVNDAGAHQLLIEETDKRLGAWPLFNPIRREHQLQAGKLVKATAAE